MKYTSDLDEYALSEGDNTTTIAIAAAMTTKTTMTSAGNIYSGSYNLVEYAAASIAVVSSTVANSKEQLSYQSALSDSLKQQYTSFSGVNLDEEVANMILFQQAYNAAAKVITTLKDMLDTLVNIVR
jgi:flagellar hook-associated protein 1 FlgK